MRKNGINRELRPIAGGICAPEGYKANAVACGLKRDGGLDFAMIFSPRRCAVACAYAEGITQGAPVLATKRNMRNGYARAILVNSGVANVLSNDGEKFANSVCDLLFPYGVERGETVICSTGKIGEPLRIAPYKDAIKSLWEGLEASAEKSSLVAQAMMTEDSFPKELSFSFDLGDYPCKIGAVFKGGPQICPNMATFLAFLTTDVNITSPMLQKALTAATRETLNMLNLDGVSSPNDTVCILANGRAGNYKIDCADSEYKKFVGALTSVLREVCLLTAKDGASKAFTCFVGGAQSKQTARAAAKAIVGAEGIKDGLKRKEIDVEATLYTLMEYVDGKDLERVRITLTSSKGEVSLFECGRAFSHSPERIASLLSGEEVELGVFLRGGNYGARAYGRI